MKISRKGKRRLQAGLVCIVCCMAIAFSIIVALCIAKIMVWPFRVTSVTRDETEDVEETPALTISPEPTDEQAPTPEPISEEEKRIQEVLETFGERCTGNEPQITDPATWKQAGKELYDKLTSDSFLVNECGLRMDEKDSCPYMIAVNRIANTVTVLTIDEDGNYTVPYMAFVCSAGEDTPLGFYATYEEYGWKYLFGPCFGQYAVRFWGSYLFHSVPYYTQYQDDLEYDQYNLLGTLASLGCVRLAVVDIKWIHDNCPLGTNVVVYDDAENPGPMGKPGTIYTDPKNLELRGWDPTDPDERNPWDDKYLPGTAIRSTAAWEEYDAAMGDGRWNKSLISTPLRGYSTDSSVEGTRG